jgi:hypothetical protein
VSRLLSGSLDREYSLVAQLGLLVIAAGLLLGGLWPLLGLEKSKKKTHPGVAITMIIVAAALAVFALLVLPRL